MQQVVLFASLRSYVAGLALRATSAGRRRRASGRALLSRPRQGPATALAAHDLGPSPARPYSVNGERRSFALLRPVTEATAQDRVRDLVLAAYAEAEAANAA